MGKKAPAQPAAPDPVATANAQAAQNAETARVNAALNREDQYTPYGSLTYSLIGGGKQGGAAPASGGQTLQPTAAQPTAAQPAQQGIWRDEGGGSYRNMNTGALERYSAPPGSPGGEPGTFYGAAPTSAAPAAIATGAATALPGQGEQRWQSRVTLAPEQQRMLDLQNQAGIQYGETANRQMGAVSDRLAAPLDFSTLGPRAAAPDFSTLGPRPEADTAMRESILANMLQRQNPQWDRERASIETQLANQGIVAGSEAWKRGMDDFTRSRNDMRLAMDQQAGNEMSRMWQMQDANRARAVNEMSSQWQMQGTDRDRAMNEMVQQRQIPLNELAAMLSGGQVQSPTFAPTPQVNMQPVDVAGLTYGSYNAQQNAANSQRQANATQNQGLYSLLGTGAQAAFMFSDRRLKRDIRRIGKLPNGLNVYRYRYQWSDEETTGVMADEVRAIAPWAVERVGSHDRVNYAEIV